MCLSDPDRLYERPKGKLVMPYGNRCATLTAPKFKH